jgi:hypothetical protein
MTTPTVNISPATVEALAQSIVRLLREESPLPLSTQLVDAAEVARRFRLSRAYVYAHADQLGAIRVGDGSRPRLRFDPDRVAERLTARQAGRRSGSQKAACQAKSKLRPRKGRAQSQNLLPIRPPGGPSGNAAKR